MNTFNKFSIAVVLLSILSCGINAKYLASCGKGEMKLWDLETRREREHLVDGNLSFPSEFSPDGRLIASFKGGRIRIWDVLQREMIYAFGENEKVVMLSFSNDTRYLASVSENGEDEIKIWDLQTQTPTLVRTIKEQQMVNLLEMNPDGSHVAVGFGNGEIKIYNLGGRLIHTLTDLQGDLVNAISFDPDGTYLAACNGSERKIRVWNLLTGKVVLNLQATHNAENRVVKFSPDGRHLVSVCAIGVGLPGPLKISIWEIKDQRGRITGRFIKTLREEVEAGDPHTLTFSQDGRHIALGDLNGDVTMWEIKNPQGTITGNPVATLRGHEGGILALAFVYEKEEDVGLEERLRFLRKRMKGQDGKKLLSPKPFLPTE